jgi:hypothetical protein
VTGRTANALTVVALLGFAATVSTTAPRWARHLRQPIEALEEEPPAEGSEATPAPPGSADTGVDVAQRMISVKLFFEAADRRGLVPEERSVALHADLAEQIRVVTEELIRGSQQGLLAPLPPETQVLDVFVTARGVAYVDLSKEVRGGQPGGAESELHAVYAVVDSIIENFPAVRRVQLLVDDRPAETLAGHVDLSRPLAADLTLLAPAPVVEPPPAGPSPGAAPSLPPSTDGSGGAGSAEAAGRPSTPSAGGTS